MAGVVFSLSRAAHHAASCRAAPAQPLPRSLFPSRPAQSQWWLFGLGFLCPLLWIVACFAPLVACYTAGAATARRTFHNRSAVVAWSLSFTAALMAVIVGSVAGALLTIGAGHGKAAGGLGSEWVVGGVPLGAGAPLP